MKVLYISHHKEGSGWARAAIDNILALDAAGVDVVCRSVDINPTTQTPEILVPFEKKECYDAEYCIQHVLPHHIVGTTKYKKNVAFLEFETSLLSKSPWSVYLDAVDEIWCSNVDLCINSVCDKPEVVLMPHACDITKYSQIYPEITLGDLDNKFKFYTIVDLNDRKNLKSTIRAFHSEFDPSEQVALILKVKKFGLTEKQLHDYVSGICLEVKKSLRMYPSVLDYHKEVIMTGNMTDDQIMSLHQYGDCFINTSYGESWSIPTFNAMAMGKTPICTNYGGPATYIDSKKQDLGVLIDGCRMICECRDSAIPSLFTGRDHWIQIDEVSVMDNMRFYETVRKDRKSVGIMRAKDFSYLNVGNKMVERLNEHK